MLNRTGTTESQHSFVEDAVRRRTAAAVMSTLVLLLPAFGAAQPAVPSTGERDRPRMTLGPVTHLFDPPRDTNTHHPSVAIGPDGRATFLFVADGTTLLTADRPGPADPHVIVGHTPEQLVGDTDEPPQLAMDRAGNATALWVQEPWDPMTGEVGDGRLMASFRPAGGQWSDPSPVVTGRLAREPSNPHLDVSPNGASVVVWHGTRGRVTSAYRPAGATTWGEAEIVPEYRELTPQVSIDDRGRALVMFTRNGNSLYWNRRDPVRGWGKTRLLQRGNPDIVDPRSTMNANGTAVATWVRLLPINNSDHLFRYEMRFARMSPAGKWRQQDDATFRFGSSYNSVYPDVPPQALVIDADGRATFTWPRGDEVWVMTGRPRGDWSEPRRIARDAHLEWQHRLPAPAHWPRITLSSRGGALVTWQTRWPGFGLRVEGRYRLGGSWATRRVLTGQGPVLGVLRCGGSAGESSAGVDGDETRGRCPEHLGHAVIGLVQGPGADACDYDRRRFVGLLARSGFGGRSEDEVAARPR